LETTAFYTKPETTAEREEFYQRLDRRSAAPLWKVLGEIVTPQPRTPCLPVMWSYEEMRPLVMESGQLITAKEAERRVLMLENPGLRGASSITRSLYAGLQLVLPGEVTPTHRHAAAALRFVLEGVGAYTAVEGERITMHPGDLILTPSWTYHDHGNPSDVPVVWLDGLDIPTVNFFDASFAEHHPDETQPVIQNGGATFAYPYSRSRDELDRLYRGGPLDPCAGVKMQYATMPTIGAFLQLLPAGFRGEASRSTDATVYCVAEGRGRSQLGDSSFEWKQHDIFVVPSWYPVSHQAQDESVLFSFSDRPAQKSLGLWREE
jgi:gentisate 1,2-dioxygenase